MVARNAAGRRGASGAGRGGRPRTAERQRRDAHILRVAGELFLHNGFGATSMDAVAGQAGISKRTLYARHADKSALFDAVLRDLIDRCAVPIDRLPAAPGDLRAALTSLARRLARAALSPAAVDVHRLIIAESRRRPAFGRRVDEAARRPAIRLIAAILARHRNELALADFAMAADQFMAVAIDGHLRLATLGIAVTDRDVDKRVRAAVALFLLGARRRTRAPRGARNRIKRTR